MRLANQIVVVLVIALGVFAIWQYWLQQTGEPAPGLRIGVLAGCMALVSIPMLARGISMVFTSRWFIGVACLTLGALLSIGLFVLCAHLVSMINFHRM